MNKPAAENLIDIGKIVNTRGLKGHLKAQSWCDSPEDFCNYKNLVINNNHYIVSSCAIYRGLVYFTLEGIDSLYKAEPLIDSVVYAEKLVLPDDTYYIKDLLGMTVYENNELLGELTDYIPTGSNDVYVITLADGGELLVPAIKQVIKRVDVKAKQMHIERMEGMS